MGPVSLEFNVATHSSLEKLVQKWTKIEKVHLFGSREIELREHLDSEV